MLKMREPLLHAIAAFHTTATREIWRRDSRHLAASEDGSVPKIFYAIRAWRRGRPWWTGSLEFHV